MEQLTIWRRIGGWIWANVFRQGSGNERREGRLDVRQMQQTFFALYDRLDARDKDKDSRIEALEARVDECDDDRAKLHEKCNDIEEKHAECEKRTQKLSTELQAVKTKVDESIRVNGDGKQ